LFGINVFSFTCNSVFMNKRDVSINNIPGCGSSFKTFSWIAFIEVNYGFR
jgi:hypothetical protein